MAVIVLVIDAQLYEVSLSTGCCVSLRALPKNELFAGSPVWTMVSPAHHPMLRQNRVESLRKIVSLRARRCCSDQKLEPASSAAQAMEKRFDMRA